jgi:hypothetical protein
MEGFGAHYAVTLHRAELRQAVVQAHAKREINPPRLRLPWRFAIAGVNQATTDRRRNPATAQILRLLRMSHTEPRPDHHLRSATQLVHL